MGLLTQLGGGQGYLKAGFLGFNKSGKTWTAALLACGVRDFFKLDGPVAMFDTEGGSEYVNPLVRKLSGQDLVGMRSRSLADLINATKEAEAGGVSALIVDSVTHVWREVCDAYLKQTNERLIKRHRDPRTRLEFQDWGPIKNKWAEWADLYLNSRLHIVICGRAGYEYDYEDREDGSGKDLVKTGVKMKTEGEFGFEPSLLVQMERVQKMEGQKLGKGFTHHATVIGDRFGVLDGAEADDPSFEFFLPHVAALTPGAHAPIDIDAKTDMGIGGDGDAAWNRERRDRVILCEEIQGEILKAFPGQTKDEKIAKAELIEAAFHTKSWTKVEGLSSVELRKGLQEIREVLAAKASAESEVA